MPVPARRPAPRAEPSASDPRERERELVALVREGDEAAFEALFTTYYPSLTSFAQSCLPTLEDAEEVVQAVFLRVWQHRAEWRPDSVRAYLFGAVRNNAMNSRRHHRIVARFGEMATPEEMAAATARPPALPDEELHSTELAEALRRAVHELPERRRQVVVLRWQHQLSRAEIASVLGVSVRTVEAHFGRALVFLRKRLAPFRP